MIRATFNIDDVVARRLADAVDEALAATAAQVARDIPVKIRAGEAPGGGAQRQNAPSTAAAKRKALGHATPLVGRERRLSEDGAFVVRRVGPARYEVRPPTERLGVLPHLVRLGYKVTGYGQEAVATFRKRVRELLGG